ncbi:HEPN domain-containing protein [candidate division KSB1 bacterium]|nr:HEPN domain-containing protein [candidate division KSB1 bacterium]
MNYKQKIDLWKQQAMHDLEVAEKNYSFHIYDYRLIACEQAVEKILKALYIKVKCEEPPKIHSLRKLALFVNMHDRLSDLLIELDEYYFMLRYPGMNDEPPFELCDDDDAKEGLNKAREIIRIILEELK